MGWWVKLLPAVAVVALVATAVAITARRPLYL
jgi:hypothetical protein